MLQRMLGLIMRGQQLGLRWRTVPYHILPGREFITFTSHLEALPWILLDLRGRLQPLVLRIGVGIGPIDGQFKQPGSKVTGECVTGAHRALNALRAEAENARAAGFACANPRGSGRKSRRKPANGARLRPPLTRFCGINYDFDADAFYALQDPIIHRMRFADWYAFVPEALPEPLPAQQGPQNGTAAIASANGGASFDESTGDAAGAGMDESVGRAFSEDESAGFDLPEDDPVIWEDGAEVPAWLGICGYARDRARAEFLFSRREPGFVHAPIVAPSAAPGPRSRRGYFSELMAAASGIEQLISERFYFALYG